MKARYRPKGGKGTRFVHTLNGSGLAVGRTLIADPGELPAGRRLGRDPRRAACPTWAASSHRRMKVRDAIKLIENDGWRLVATRGSHRQFKHPRKPGRATIAGKPSDDLAPGTFNSILKQAGLKAEEK